MRWNLRLSALLRVPVLIAVLGLLSLPAAHAQTLKGKLGIGTNWPGLHLKYCFSNFVQAELRGQVASNNSIGGIRLTYLFNRKSSKLVPYIGAEYDMIFSKYIREGFEAGSYIGFEKYFGRHVGINLDAGMYYVDVKGSLGGICDTGLILNMGLTYYF